MSRGDARYRQGGTVTGKVLFRRPPCHSHLPQWFKDMAAESKGNVTIEIDPSYSIDDVVAKVLSNIKVCAH